MSNSAKKGHPTVRCKECKTPLLEPSKTGLCRFCAIELGVEKPV